MQNIAALDNTFSAKKNKQLKTNSALRWPGLQSFNTLSFKLITTVFLDILQNFELTNKHAGKKI